MLGHRVAPSPDVGPTSAGALKVGGGSPAVGIEMVHPYRTTPVATTVAHRLQCRRPPKAWRVDPQISPRGDCPIPFSIIKAVLLGSNGQ